MSEVQYPYVQYYGSLRYIVNKSLPNLIVKRHTQRIQRQTSMIRKFTKAPYYQNINFYAYKQ